MSDNNPTLALLERIRTDIFDRLYRGELRYDNDMKTLNKHLRLAEEMGSQLMVGRIHNMIGIVEGAMGNLSSSIEHYNAAFEVFWEDQNAAEMGKVKNNLGEFYREIGEYRQALDNYQEARDILSGIDDKETLPLLESNMGLAWLALGEFLQAEFHFLVVIQLVSDRTWEQIDALMEARRGLAEVYLEQGNYARAWRNIDEAYSLASGAQDHLTLIYINLTRAHIAEHDPHSPLSAQEYYALSREGFQNQELPIMTARTLLDEARYHLRHGNMNMVKRLVSEALGIYNRLGVNEERQFAETLLRP